MLVCDVALPQVREAASRATGCAVQVTPVPGQGTRIELLPTEDPVAFQEVVRAAIVEAQQNLAADQ